jgi:hypothetical protein
MSCFIMKGEVTPSADQKKASLLNNVRKLLNGGNTRQQPTFSTNSVASVPDVMWRNEWVDGLKYFMPIEIVCCFVTRIAPTPCVDCKPIIGYDNPSNHPNPIQCPRYDALPPRLGSDSQRLL